jgi:hypothetical protein
MDKAAKIGELGYRLCMLAAVGVMVWRYDQFLRETTARAKASEAQLGQFLDTVMVARHEGEF